MLIGCTSGDLVDDCADFAGNLITDKGVAELAAALEINTSVTYIGLGSE